MSEWTGTIHTDRVAIGGETLGLALESDDGWFDLIPDDDTTRPTPISCVFAT